LIVIVLSQKIGICLLVPSITWTRCLSPESHVASIHFDRAKKDYRTELQQIKNSRPDAVFAVTYADDGIIIFRQAGEMGLDNIAWLGCDGNYGSGLFKDARAAEFMEKAVVAGTRIADPSGEAYDKFAQAYTDRYGEVPEVYCDTTYDCVKLVARAIERAGKYDGKAIKDALVEVGRNYGGASGIISFDPKDDRASGAFEVWRVEKDPTANYGYRNAKLKVIHLD